MAATEVQITERHRVASEAIRASGEFSIANPHASGDENPFWKATQKATRGLGRYACRCGRVMPFVTADLRTECCRATTVTKR